MKTMMHTSWPHRGHVRGGFRRCGPVARLRVVAPRTVERLGLDPLLGLGRGLLRGGLLYRFVEAGLLVGIGSDLLAPGGVRSQYPMIAVAMASLRRNRATSLAGHTLAQGVDGHVIR